MSFEAENKMYAFIFFIFYILYLDLVESNQNFAKMRGNINKVEITIFVICI